MKTFSFQRLPNANGFLDVVSSKIQDWTVDCRFPVLTWHQFIDQVRSKVNPLCSEDHLKDLIQEAHMLAVPDEAAAIAAANAWLGGHPATGRPYELGADTSGYAIGGVTWQCQSSDGKLLALLYVSAHLVPRQQNWHPFEQEFWGC